MLFNPLIIKLINIILGTNTGGRELLARHSGKTFKLILPGISMSAACDIDGYLVNHKSAQCAVIINIPLDSATFLINQDKLAVYKKISFSGDAAFGHELLEIFAHLHLDGIYTKVSSPIMLLVLNQLTNLIKMSAGYLKLVTVNTSEMIKEHLMYETQDIITQFENDKFCDIVDELNARSQQLEQRIQDYVKINKAPSK